MSFTADKNIFKIIAIAFDLRWNDKLKESEEFQLKDWNTSFKIKHNGLFYYCKDLLNFKRASGQILQDILTKNETILKKVDINIKILNINCDFCKKEFFKLTNIIDDGLLLKICDNCLKEEYGIENLNEGDKK